uniref:Serpin domain-containing protein n=1 Tax=Callorhinchus milii TaxID=7868 RepID=A0A4W3JBH9_CALMI|eukprot:gi/632957814/ref/XP_007894689.1/ PREDICTED: pigment epithelium-derived factor [Callorhinchus milii]
MKSLIVLVSLTALSSLSLTQDEGFPQGSFNEERTFLEMTDLPFEEEEELPTNPVQRVALAISTFGYDLYRKVAQKTPTANVFMSPLSVATALSELSLGVAEPNEQMLHRVLNFRSLNDLEIHKVYKDLIAEITSPPKQFKMGARMYTRRLKMKPNFLKEVQKFYGETPKALGNKPQISLWNINQWVNQKTQVDRMMTSVPLRLSIFLLSVGHFKGQLMTGFISANIMQKPFRVDQDTVVYVPMMTEIDYPLRFGYDSDLKCKIGMFPFVGDISMFIFLPDVISSNMTQLEDNLNPGFIQDLIEQLQEVPTSVSLPKLRLKAVTELKEQLELEPLYTLSRMPKIANPPLKISSIKHLAVLELQENGIEESVKEEGGRELMLDFHVNRPFILVLHDNASGSLLFIGRVMDPRGLIVI